MATLKSDVSRFLSVYKQNMTDILHQQLPRNVASVMEAKLLEEFSLFEVSLKNRLKEEFDAW